jgi:hypothetical protein
MTIKRVVSLFAVCLVLSALTVFADETWQGNAAISLRGELDRDGYYAASNSFPPGTKILVTNLDNGRRVIVTVRQRLDGTSNVFLLLSSNAGNDLGMKPTDVARIKTQVVGISTDLTGGVDLALNRDMETNPAVGAPDLTKTTPTPGPVLAETSPSPSPSPSPTPSLTPQPSPTPAVVEETKSRLQKDRFAPPTAEEAGDLTARTSPPPAGKETTGEVELKEARVALKEKGEAVILSRPNAEAAGEKGEVVAILVEPKSVKKTVTTAGVTDLERPLPDRETVEAALNDPELVEKEKPFVYERHGTSPEGEELALASHDLPEAARGERPEVESYAKVAGEAERLALETHDLPEVRQGEKADVTGLAKAEAEKDRVALETHVLPELVQGEKPDVLQREEVGGKDKKSVELALVPTNPNPPKKTVTTTVEPTKVEPTKVETTEKTNVTAPVWENTSEFTKNYYYLQLGVFTTREAAEKILRAYPSYPMLIIAGKLDKADVFKVVVGPLKRDETGTALYLFKARGYRDAFLKYIE